MERGKGIGVKFILAFTVAVLSGFLMAGNAAAVITGSAHDFSSEGWSGGKVCGVCHTPHNSDATFQAPLWNHGTTAATFTFYDSSTMDSTTGEPDGTSKACLSCHDGTVALDSFGGATGSTTITGTALLGTDLSNDHPVSFIYDAALATADGELTTPAGDGSAVGDVPLFSGKVECSSCHDVHNNAGTSASLLVKDNAGSALCLTCHTK